MQGETRSPTSSFTSVQQDLPRGHPEPCFKARAMRVPGEDEIAFEQIDRGAAGDDPEARRGERGNFIESCDKLLYRHNQTR